MAQVKICGLTDTAHIRAAAEAGADWVGFVLYPKSPRNILGEGEDALDEVCALSDFAQDLGPRCEWFAEVTMKNGQKLDCRFVPLSGGATLVGFLPRLTPDAADTPPDA